MVTAAATQLKPSKALSQPLRIALLGYRSNPFSGGQGIYIKYVARALNELGHEVHVISGEPYPELDDGIRLIKLPGLNLFAKAHPTRALRWQHLKSTTDLFEWVSMISGGFPEPYTFGRRVSEYFREHGHEYDVVHDNQCLSYGTLELQLMGLPLVTTIHHPITHDLDIALANTSQIYKKLLIRRWHLFLGMQKKVARQLKHITTVSECSKDDICKAFDVQPTRVQVIYNGVDCDEFKPLPNVPRAAQHLITTASADQPLKGTQHLVPALASLVNEFSDLRLTFIGKPKPDGDTARLINKYDLAEHIDFKHGISATEIVELYARATLAVVPSEYEGFGLPAAEAMACAVPIVSTDGGALPEVVGEAGIIVPKANPDALAAGIRSLLLDPDKRNTLGAAGHNRMLTRFNWADVATSLTDYYHQVISA